MWLSVFLLIIFWGYLFDGLLSVRGLLGVCSLSAYCLLVVCLLSACCLSVACLLPARVTVSFVQARDLMQCTGNSLQFLAGCSFSLTLLQLLALLALLPPALHAGNNLLIVCPVVFLYNHLISPLA